jgi:putative phosphoribosyl transferase
MRDFEDRHDAGSRLAEAARAYAERTDVVVLALPRGGVVIGYEVATRLGLPLDVMVVRKLGVPGHAELAMGAISSGGVVVVDPSITAALRISQKSFDAVLADERAELQRRERLFRGHRRRDPARIVVAVPVASPEAVTALRSVVDEVICLLEPPMFYAVGLWYVDFSQTADSEVRTLLDAAARAYEARSRTAATASTSAPP